MLKDRRARTSYLLLLNLLIVAFLAGAYLLFNSKADATSVTTESSWQIPVEIADSGAERTLGLSGRDSIDGGLLFVFDREERHGIWMKDMKFPIDIVWLDADRRIVTIKKNVSPETYPKIFYPDAPSLYVLELKSGDAESYQLSNNQSLRFNW